MQMKVYFLHICRDVAPTDNSLTSGATPRQKGIEKRMPHRAGILRNAPSGGCFGILCKMLYRNVL